MKQSLMLRVTCFEFESIYNNDKLFSADEMEISGENYRIIYDPTTVTISCEGTLRLYGATGYVSLSEFKKVHTSGETPERQDEPAGYFSFMGLFNKVLNQRPATITLKPQKLQSLNSSGINVFSKFVINVRDQKMSQLIIQGTRRFPWQSKVLENLQKLMPDLVLEWE